MRRTLVPLFLTNAHGEDIVFRDSTLLQIEGAVNLSTTERVSIENEGALLDETVQISYALSLFRTLDLL